MIRWEYHLATMAWPCDPAALNSYGQDGWELCGIVGNEVVFKRPIFPPTVRSGMSEWAGGQGQGQEAPESTSQS